jgi:Carboxypeptidase regulatory-like domain
MAVAAATVLGAGAPGALASTGSLSGTVTDASTGLPVPGVQVSAWREVNPTLTEGASDYSDAGGHYTISGLPEADYAIQFSPDDLNYVPEYYDHRPSEAQADLVHLGAGESRSGLDAALTVGGQIAGRVVGAVGKNPLKGVDVCAYSETDFTGGCAQTDGNGEYTVNGLPSDSYAVQISPHGWSLNYFGQAFHGVGLWDQPNWTWVPVTVGAKTSGIGAELDEGAGITGRVFDGSTLAGIVDGIEVCAIEVGGEEFAYCSETEPGGWYTVGGMPSGEYKVVFSPEHRRDDPERSAVEDGFAAEYYEGAISRAQAETFSLTAPTTRSGVDATLVNKFSVTSGSTSPHGSPVVWPGAPPRPSLRCAKHFKKKWVKGKPRCVKIRPMRHRRGSP